VPKPRNDSAPEGLSAGRGELPATMDTPSEKTIVRQSDIEAGLREVGLRAGDVALVHSSLSSMGWVEGGTQTVIEAFLSVLDPESGTFVVPTLCASKPRERRFDVWDIERSPSDVGAITEAGRLHPQAIRSDHGTHSVAAIGAHAEQITGGHADSWGRPSPWGPAAFGFGSPWQWLYDLDAHYLFLGVTTSCNTIGHFAQAELVRRHLQAAGDAREELEAELRAWERGGVWPNFRFEMAEEWLAEKGAMRYSTIGDATLRATHARANVDTILEKLSTEAEEFLEPGFLDWLERARAAKENRDDR